MALSVFPLTPPANNLEAEAPLPPEHLARRVGVPETGGDVLEAYRRLGADSRSTICSLLPAEWSFDGKRVLDFGSGAGKVLRHFLPEAERAELWGCDIDAEAIAWLSGNLCPPLHACVNREKPPLEQPAGSFDLIWAVSVFTHLTRGWAPWLAELHRVLCDGGLLIATFLGQAVWEPRTGRSWPGDDRVGMKVLDRRQGWDLGGPTVFHSERWLRRHWGRAFELVELRHGEAPGEHGVVLMRRRPGSAGARQLRRRRG